MNSKYKGQKRQVHCIGLYTSFLLFFCRLIDLPVGQGSRQELLSSIDGNKSSWDNQRQSQDRQGLGLNLNLYVRYSMVLMKLL